MNKQQWSHKKKPRWVVGRETAKGFMQNGREVVVEQRRQNRDPLTVAVEKERRRQNRETAVLRAAK